jgi:hypothetical protein
MLRILFFLGEFNIIVEYFYILYPSLGNLMSGLCEWDSPCHTHTHTVLVRDDMKAQQLSSDRGEG